MEKQKIKLLHLIGGGEIGGAERHILSLITALPKDRFNIALASLIDGPLARLSRDQGIETYVFPMQNPHDLSPLLKLVKLGRQLDLSLIHTHGLRANLIGRIAAKRLSIPSVTTVHSSLKHDYTSSWKALVAQSLERLTLKLPSGFTAVSNSIAQEILRNGARNVRVIYNGEPSLKLSSPDSLRNQFREEWGIPLESLVLGCTARLHPAKGHSYLIEAAQKLQSVYPHLHLLLVGEGPLRKKIEATLKRSSLNYTLTGFLPDAYNALPAMDIFILPSVSEGMGIVLLEALQAGVPIVSTTAGGIPEVIRSGIDGLLVPPANSEALREALKKMIDNAQLREQLIISGAKRSQDFSIQRMVNETTRFYEELVQA